MVSEGETWKVRVRKSKEEVRKENEGGGREWKNKGMGRRQIEGKGVTKGYTHTRQREG